MTNVTHQEGIGILLETAGRCTGKQEFIVTLRLGYVKKYLANDKQHWTTSIHLAEIYR